jgi:hypothetical protein
MIGLSHASYRTQDKFNLNHRFPVFLESFLCFQTLSPRSNVTTVRNLHKEGLEEGTPASLPGTPTAPPSHTDLLSTPTIQPLPFTTIQYIRGRLTQLA